MDTAPAPIDLLPIELGEHKTRQGLRAFVVRTNTVLRCGYGFIERERHRQVYRTKGTWGLESGKAVFIRGHSSDSFDLVARLEPRLTPETASKWPQEHSTLLEHWEWAKD